MLASYEDKRTELQVYFDRTASETWARLTSDRPVSRIRATVRAGRDRMRAGLLSWLPDDLSGARILDAGCGTGALAIEAARRGADVVAIDVAASLVSIAEERFPATMPRGRVEFRVGDMLDPALGRFDYVVAMDSLIHYRADDMVEMVRRLSERADRKVLFTFAPRTVLLTLMHWVGRLFPRSDRAPAIEPVTERGLRRRLATKEGLERWAIGRTDRIKSGFYTSQALEIEQS